MNFTTLIILIFTAILAIGTVLKGLRENRNCCTRWKICIVDLEKLPALLYDKGLSKITNVG